MPLRSSGQYAQVFENISKVAIITWSMTSRVTSQTRTSGRKFTVLIRLHASMESIYANIFDVICAAANSFDKVFNRRPQFFSIVRVLKRTIGVPVAVSWVRAHVENVSHRTFADHFHMLFVHVLQLWCIVLCLACITDVVALPVAVYPLLGCLENANTRKHLHGKHWRGKR